MSASALVTGATGFVGSHLVGRLLERGWSVCAAVRPTSPTDRLPLEHPRLGVRAVDGSAQGFRDVLREAEADTVFHLAARYVGQHSADDLDDLVTSNIGLTTHLLQGMADAGTKRVVVASTVWRRHGELDDHPVNLYAATKAAVEPIIGFYSAASALSAVVLELGDTYGPADPRGKVVSVAMRAAREGTRLEMSPGDQLLDLTHIDDVVRAFEVAAERLDRVPADPGVETFHALSGELVSLRDLLAEVGALLGHDIEVAWGARDHRPREVMRPASAHPRLPGWTPEVERRDGLRTLID